MEVIMTKQKKKHYTLNEEQIELIKKTHDILDDVLDEIWNMQDINLSQIKKLSETYYELKYKFDFYEGK